MVDARPNKKSSLTPAKGALIAILSRILVVVLVSQFASGSGNTVPQSTRSIAKPKLTTANATQQKPIQQNSVPQTPAPQDPWPRLSLDDVIQHDPFALPTSWQGEQRQRISTKAAHGNEVEDEILREHEEQLLETLSDLREQGVSLVVTGKHGKSAMIGSRRVEVGDMVSGFVVKDIQADGVILEEGNQRQK